MRVLLLHNRYRQAGGEDLVVRDETKLLRNKGVQVYTHEVDNQGSSADLALNAQWARNSFREIRELCRSLQPDVVHVHNFWMKLSPAVHAASHLEGVPTVQTLHNFRLLCANALFLRNGRTCEDCLGKLPWRGIVHKCYHDSIVHSAVVVGMIAANRWRRTWHRYVDAFVTLSEHSAAKFLRGGLPAERTFVKPNFIEDPGPSLNAPSTSKTVVYVGRLSKEKGVSSLLAAWAAGGLSAFGRLLIVGDGPERTYLERQAVSYGFPESNVVFLGQLASDDVRRIQADCRSAVIPSLCYETFGRTVVEAFSHGRPAVVSDGGAAAELVDCNATGFKVDPGNHAALAGTLRRMLLDNELADRLGETARQVYLSRYTPEKNFDKLIEIYRFAIQRSQRKTQNK